MGPAELSLQPWDPVSPHLAQAHGNVFTTWVGPTPVVVLSGFWVVKEALVSNSEQFSGRPLTPLFRDVFGERGVICSNGHTWRQQRRFCLATLRELGLGKLALELQLQGEAAELAEGFHQEQGRPFDPRVHIVTSTARVIGTLVFGCRFLLEDPFFQELIQAIDFGLAFVSTIWCRLYDRFPWAFHRLPGPHQEMFRYQKAVRSYICREISRHKLRTPEAPKEFISCYLAQITKATDDPVSTFNEENLIQVVVDLFLGGTDTTATTLCWALIYVVQHGAIRGKGAMDRELLPYTRTVREVQRLSRVVTTDAVRQCVTSTHVHGHPVPKAWQLSSAHRVFSELISAQHQGWVLGQLSSLSHTSSSLEGTIILSNLASVLYDPECWETPNNSTLATSWTRMETSWASVCLGDQLAWMELFLMFATLLRTFWFQLPEGSPGLRREYVFGGTRQPRPQKICAVPHLNCPNPGPGEEGV
ncbi:cytochrome P450 2J2-like [Sagmatias obliquidens]|uniref:cytochrome P450 2J2-like n=1 Tax=Sagmatias obliquidens TaxID=3371155 RepID=UPI000F445B5E|nr:cytochrome P450 2J2-like [Lagenorhynchus obliquidens]